MAYIRPDRFPAEDPLHSLDAEARARAVDLEGAAAADRDSAVEGAETSVTVHAQDRDADRGDKRPAVNVGEVDQLPQPSGDSGVTTDMATLALTPGRFETANRRPDASGQAGTARAIADMSDAEIMLQVRDGDDGCFNYLIEKYRTPIMHFMFRMVHNQAVAEEMAQEVFLRVYRSRHTYRAEAKFTTWLYRIATNLGVNHARDTKYERAAQNVYLDEPDAETGTTPDVADTKLTAEQDLLRHERFRAIRQQVMALPERQKTAVLMHKYQGMDYKEIGEVLKLSESATKSLLFRAYQTLRERLKDFV